MLATNVGCTPAEQVLAFPGPSFFVRLSSSPIFAFFYSRGAKDDSLCKVLRDACIWYNDLAYGDMIATVFKLMAAGSVHFAD